MRNNIINKLKEGNPVIGTFFEIGGNTAVECLGISGLDFLIIDSEHGPFDVESTMSYIRTAELKGIIPFVRVKNKNRDSILKMLDIGAKGIVIPCVETVEEVKKIVEYGKYAPLGSRGFFYGRVGEYGFSEDARSVDKYFKSCNENTMLIPQCETLGCLENIEEIVGIKGVDGIFIGPYDLSIAMGKSAQFKDPEFIAAIERILKACKDAGKFAFIFTGNTDLAKMYFDQGFDGVAINTDVS
ncbi:MAG: aldolase/citrate lyase family protein, partial [Acidaminobacteraceae bacterium]